MRRVEAPTRANTPLITYDEKFGLVKVNPIAAWTDEDMDAYIAEHNILVNPLVGRGLPEHRLRAVHGQAGAGRRQAQRPLGRHRQDRVRVALAHDRTGAWTRWTRSSPSRSTSSGRWPASSTGR